jgi:KUP system potassium uptake protein
LKDGLLLNAYFKLKNHSLREAQAFGSDKSDIEIEQIPLLFQPINNINLLRNE